MQDSTTVGQLLSYLTLGSSHPLEVAKFDEWWLGICRWPPNLFAVTAAILQESGVYRVNLESPLVDRDAVLRWVKALGENTHLTEHCCAGSAGMLPELERLGCELRRVLDKPFVADDAQSDDAGRIALVTLHAIADEACLHCSTSQTLLEQYMKEWSPNNPGSHAWPQKTRDRARQRLRSRGTLSCLDTSKIRVLPKKHTPQVGITLRSHSLYAAATRGEVDVQWVEASTSPVACDVRSKRHVNLLLVPWPLDLNAASFREWGTGSELCAGRKEFVYEPSGRNPEIVGFLESLLGALEQRGVEIDGVVLPELALSGNEFRAIRDLMKRPGIPEDAFLLSGVRGEDAASPSNEAWLAVGDAVAKQQKHHKWCLDAGQIRQYHIASSLLPCQENRYWERMPIGRRTVSFVPWRRGLTMCPLICEDLARVEPVSETIRAVGPNLVIGLLLDGPQFEKRWPGRYASVFAEDPGSSVLTLSAYGMVKRCAGPGQSPSNVVALWKDKLTGTRELSLPTGSEALVLSLCTNFVTEETYDGRIDSRTGVLTFGGVEGLSGRN